MEEVGMERGKGVRVRGTRQESIEDALFAHMQ